MNSRRKILAIALIAALVGGVVGAFAFRDSGESSAASAPVYVNSAPVVPDATVADNGQPIVNPDVPWGDYGAGESNTVQTNGTVAQTAPVQVRTVTRTRYANAPTYYRTEPRKRSFWQKHRDKLTVAMGTGGGALIGGLIGGKKGAIIGALGGAGGSALYTYKIRKRDRRY